jgi:hypothetical protein
MQNAALPAAPYTIDLGYMQNVPSTNILVTSLALKNSGANAIRSYGARSDSAGMWYLNDQSWTSVIVPGAQNTTTTGIFNAGTMAFVRITDDGTNRRVYWSLNGRDYQLFISQASGTGVVPDRAGIIFYDANTSTGMTVSIYHWLISNSILPQFAA